MANRDGRFDCADFRRECTLKVEGNLRSIHAQAAGRRPSPTSASYSPLFRFVLVDALFWRLTNTWIKNNISRQNSEHEVGWWKISIPENLELEIWTGILQPGVTSCVLRLDLPTNQWVFISKHSSHLCETWQPGSFPRLQPFDELFYCKSQSRGSLCLVMVKACHWKWGIISQTVFTLFYRFSMAPSKGRVRMLPINHVHGSPETIN